MGVFCTPRWVQQNAYPSYERRCGELWRETKIFSYAFSLFSLFYISSERTRFLSSLFSLFCDIITRSCNWKQKDIITLHDITFYFFIISFMSQVLYKSTNIVVKWNKASSSTTSLDGKTKSIWPLVELDFIIQINGKLATHSIAMPIAQRVQGEITLKDWTLWYAILELFNNLWYYFMNEWERDQRSSIIQDWIREIYPEWEKERAVSIPILEE